MRREDNTPDWVIEKAADLWAQRLSAPVFDNGDNSSIGGMTYLLATSNADRAMDEASDLPARIAVFKDTLIKNLKFARDHQGEETGEIIYPGKPGEYKETYYLSHVLSTDYHPDRELAKAAEAAGIPTNLFSWKSRVFMHSDCVSAAFGYGAPDDYYYRLSDGSWVICKLHGEDMKLILSFLEHFDIPGIRRHKD